LAAGVAVAIASNALVSAIDATPRIDVSTQSTLHMETSPEQVGTVGTPNVVAAADAQPISNRQHCLRLRMDVSWALRNADGLAWLENVLW
jgi:hypothetical protein